MSTADTDGRKISLLYVEDEPDVRELMSEIIRFRYPELTLLLAENGKAGLELFKRHKPEIVITDINMPVTNGIKMAAEIKAMGSSTEIIALTAHSDTHYLLQAIEIGINHYVLKPLDVEQILKVIDKTVAAISSEREIARQNDLIRQLNAELAIKAEQLELANKELEAYDYTVAHDLRSPVVTIRDISRRVLDSHGDTLDSTVKGCLQTMQRESIRINGLVDALLRFSVRSRRFPEKKKSNLSDIVHEISRDLTGKEPWRQVAFCVEEGIHAYCDPDLIRIILENLLGNAWKYSSTKDNVLIEFGTMNAQDDLVYFVRDNGSGFDAEDAEKLFAPFHRLQGDGEIEGFGIGLATSCRIINRHGGRIWAEAEKGKGATFYFTL